MKLSNAHIALQLTQLASLLQSQGENRFKIKAYRSAAEVLRQHQKNIVELVKAGEDLTSIPGIGKGISAAIIEIVNSGQLEKVKKLASELAPGTTEIAEAAELSIRDAQRIMKKLEISTPAQLEKMLASGRVGQELGTRFEFKIRQGLLKIKRLLWKEAEILSKSFEAFIKNIPGVQRVAIAGSLRRGKETVGSLRYVIRCDSKSGVTKAILAHAGVEERLPAENNSDDTCAFKLSAGPLLVARFADETAWGDALVAETGSQTHLAELQNQSSSGVRQSGSSSERQWYKKRKLAYIEPELREGRGEVRCALDGTLPKLVTLPEICGDLHSHTTASDGANSIMEMAEAARAHGYAYLAITDHSQSLKLTNGLSIKRLRAHGAAIDEINEKLGDFRILKGSEVDILEDGSLDYPDEVLKELDIVISSVHSRFNLNRRQQTDRFVRAIENRYVTCVGHLTGRLLLKRPGYELDLDRILSALEKSGTWIEINASPDRLDIDDSTAIQVKQRGIRIAINTDAHSTGELDFMKFGILQGRRGWLEKKDVVNCLPLREFLKVLGKK